MAWSNVGTDMATRRLVKAAQGASLAGELPKDSARTLVALARASRLFIEARDIHLAMGALGRIDALVAEEKDVPIREAMFSHTAEVRRYMGKEAA